MVAENPPEIRLRLVSQSLTDRLLVPISDVFYVPDLRHSTTSTITHAGHLLAYANKARALRQNIYGRTAEGCNFLLALGALKLKHGPENTVFVQPADTFVVQLGWSLGIRHAACVRRISLGGVSSAL